MGKIKNYYLEILIGFLSFCAAIFFVYNFYSNGTNSEFLSQAKSKLLLLEARTNRANEEKLNEAEDKSCKQCFESALIESNFQVLAVEKKDNYVAAIVEKNEISRGKLNQILENVEFLQSGNRWEVRWFYNKPQKIGTENFVDNDPEIEITQKKNAKIVTESEKLKVSAICFFGENDWQVWINGKMYDQENFEIENGVVIEKVSEQFVIIRKNDKKITLNLE